MNTEKPFDRAVDRVIIRTTWGSEFKMALTNEMIKAGADKIWESNQEESVSAGMGLEEAAEQVFLAMMAVAPEAHNES